MRSESKKKKRVKNAKLVENPRQNLSYQGEVLLKQAAEAGNGGYATEIDDHMSLRVLPLRR